MHRFLYVVTAHSKPAQVARLARALVAASEAGRVLVHFDPSRERLPGETFADDPRIAVYPAPLVVRWGDFSLVEAVLGLLAWARREIPFDWVVWISGQDYPLGRLDAFERQLGDGRADAWFRHFPGYTHAGWPAGEGLRRYGFHYLDLPSFDRYYLLPLALRRGMERLTRGFNKAQRLVQVRPRHRNNPAKLGLRARNTPFTANMPCVAGWSWLNLNARAVTRLLDFVAANPAYVAHFRRTYCPDESFFHTILANDPELTVENDPLRHICWEDRPYSSNPRVITRGPLLDAALASGRPFGRKFSVDVDAGCLDVLDARIAALPASSGTMSL